MGKLSNSNENSRKLRKCKDIEKIKSVAKVNKQDSKAKKKCSINRSQQNVKSLKELRKGEVSETNGQPSDKNKKSHSLDCKKKVGHI